MKAKCNRCNHKWEKRTATPKRCPKCKTPYYNKKRKIILKRDVIAVRILDKLASLYPELEIEINSLKTLLKQGEQKERILETTTFF